MRNGARKITSGNSQKPLGNTVGIWLAFLLALGLHAIVLLLPTGANPPVAKHASVQIELELGITDPIAEIPETAITPSRTPSDPEQYQPHSVVERSAETRPETARTEPVPVPIQPAFAVTTQSRAFEQMNEDERRRLTQSILTRQFITEASVTDKLFPRPLEQAATPSRMEFRFAGRRDMISMLDQPMPDLPFEYTPGLVYFAYDPGLRGGVQRFWDKITPEFGWTTRYGTQVKCVWVLVIAACGWK